MTLKIAINGFGRIGRLVLRGILETKQTGIQVVAINDLGKIEDNAHLFKYDSVHGRYQGTVSSSGSSLTVDHMNIAMLRSFH